MLKTLFRTKNLPFGAINFHTFPPTRPDIFLYPHPYAHIMLQSIKKFYEHAMRKKLKNCENILGHNISNQPAPGCTQAPTSSIHVAGPDQHPRSRACYQLPSRDRGPPLISCSSCESEAPPCGLRANDKISINRKVF